MSKLNWDKAKKTGSSHTAPIAQAGSFKDTDDFICWDDGTPIEPELKNRLTALNSLLKSINSLKFSNKSPEKQLESIWLARKFHSSLNEGIAYFGSPVYRKAVMVLDSYQHWPPAPPTNAEIKKAQQENQRAIAELEEVVTRMSSPEFLSNSVKVQMDWARYLKSRHNNLDNKKEILYKGSSLEEKVIRTLNTLSALNDKSSTSIIYKT